MSAKTWSTDSVRAREGLSFWRDAVCEAVLNVVPEAPGETFRASLSGQAFGLLRFAAFSSTGHFIVREKGHVNRASDDHYLISLQQRGSSGLEQGGDPYWLAPGEVGIVDGTRPFRVRFPSAVSRLLAVVPRQRIEARAPWLRRGPSRKVAASSPYVDLVRRHLVELASGSLDAHQAELLTDNLCNLLALATAPQGPVEDMPSATQTEAIMAYCRARLSDLTLNPRAVAAQFGISLRTLHLRFEQTGASFGRWLLESRLQECRRILSDPAQHGRTISEIAYAAGFGDLSHFSKAFRARFGEAPRDLRKGH
ncbi:helix-turn-helix domain-containing protein [Pseudolabrys taiwanensis]|nr:helix-turn-helix domain-containing protein [Pseudolabrys taiwanensis]